MLLVLYSPLYIYGSMAYWFTLNDAGELLPLSRSASCHFREFHCVMGLEVPVCCLDLTQGAVLSSDHKQNKPQKIVSFPKSGARFAF